MNSFIVIAEVHSGEDQLSFVRDSHITLGGSKKVIVETVSKTVILISDVIVESQTDADEKFIVSFTSERGFILEKN